MTTKTLPRYSDCCDDCQPGRVAVPPLLLRANDKGTGVVADYVCPSGHTWFTGWAWWDGRPHGTDRLVA